MIRRDDIVTTARGMIGTPWTHQGRLPGVGLDCIGLVVCTLKVLGVQINDRANYGRAAAPAEFIGAVREHATEKEIPHRDVGDLLLLAPGKILHHAAIYAGNDIIIHARVDAFVEERRLDEWAFRIQFCFDLSVLHGR
jgi:cell wall-associated NlpC family hydrolase